MTMSSEAEALDYPPYAAYAAMREQTLRNWDRARTVAAIPAYQESLAAASRIYDEMESQYPTNPYGFTARYLAHLSNLYHELPTCAVGGDLHIVLDDGNIEDKHILWCITDWLTDPERWQSDEITGASVVLGWIWLQCHIGQRQYAYEMG